MTHSQPKIEKIVIVGGGSSGWMAASYLAKSLGFNVSITVVESPTIERIGVGEATVPTIKSEFFDTLGLAEEDWMPACQATYKLGVKFLNWKKSLREGSDYYYHNFGEIPSIDEVPLTHLWIKKRLEEHYQVPMDYACFSSLLACDLNKSPRFMDGTQVQHYAYHFDALLLANFLRDWSKARGVNHCYDELVDARLDEQGNIQCVISDQGTEYHGDLFIDCSGFRSFLIEKILKEPSVFYDESLLTDRAIAVNLPEEPHLTGIRPYTSATAFDAGWLWEIPLFTRSGNGYVYSSQFISEEAAEKEILDFFGERAKGLNLRHIKFQSRRRCRSWVKNCVSIGLASGFLEPLESTGLYFVYAALFQLVKHFPDKNMEPAIRDKFNQKVQYMVEDVKDFIVMHFKTSPREDTPFWRANKYETKTPPSLQLILERQRAGIPIRKSHQGDNQLYTSFAARFENFWTNSSYQCILCGVDQLPKSPLPLLYHRPDILERGEVIFKEIAEHSKYLGENLPTQYEYLRHLYAQAERKASSSQTAVSA